MAYLIFPFEDGHDVVVNVQGRVTVGSAEDNDVVVHDADVSARHAEIVPNASGVFSLRDLASRSGTKVNGFHVDSCLLSNGDEIAFGSLRGRFVLENPKAHTHISPPHPETGDLEKKIQDLSHSYNSTRAQHSMLTGMVHALADQEKAQLTSLERLHRESDELEQLVAERKEDLQKTQEALEQRRQKLSEPPPPDLTPLKAAEDKLRAQIRALEDERTEAEKALKQLAGQTDALHARVSELNAEHERLQISVGETTELHTKEEASLKELEKKRREMESAAAHFASEQAGLQKNIAALKAHHAQTEAEVKALQQSKAAAALELKKIEAEHRTASQLSEKEQKLRDALTALEARHEELTQSHIAVEESYEEWEGMLASAKSQVEAEHAHKQATEEYLAALHTEKARLEEEVTGLAANADAWHQAIAGLHQHHEQSQQQAGEYDEKLRTLHGELTSASEAAAQHETLRTQIQELTGRHASHLAEIDTLNRQLPDLRTQRQQAEKDLAAAQEALRACQALATAAKRRDEAELQSVKQILADKVAAQKDASAKAERAQQKLADLQKLAVELGDVRSKLAGAKHEVHEAEQRNSQLEKDHEDLKKEGEKLQRRISDWQSAEQAAKSRAADLEKDESSLKQSLERLKNEAQSAEAQFKQISESHAATQQQAEKRLAELTAALESRQHDIVQTEARLALLHGLEHELNARHQQLATLPEGSPQALEVSHSIQKLKEAVADALPPKDIQARPESKVMVVPRAR